MRKARTLEDKIKHFFVLVATLQAFHSVEEYAFGFTDQFPGARFLEARLPGIARPGFVFFNVLLVGLAFLSYGLWIRRERSFARAVLWVWVAIELYNGIAHVLWALIARGYIPGLVTGVLLLLAASYLAALLVKR